MIQKKWDVKDGLGGGKREEAKIKCENEDSLRHLIKLQKCIDVSARKGRRQQPFTDRMIRQFK